MSKEIKFAIVFFSFVAVIFAAGFYLIGGEERKLMNDAYVLDNRTYDGIVYEGEYESEYSDRYDRRVFTTSITGGRKCKESFMYKENKLVTIERGYCTNIDE